MSIRKLKNTGVAGTALIPLDPQLRIVVDANKVLGGLIWAVSRRKNPEARQDIIEVSDAGVAVLYAPNALKKEVQKHLPSLAEERGLSLPDLQKEWREYQKRLVFIPGGRKPRKNSLKVRDRNDMPFINAYKRLDAFGIASTDHDISGMGAPVIDIEATSKMRRYSREKAGELGILSGVSIPFIFAFALFFGLIGPVLRVLKKIWPILLISAIILVLVLLHDGAFRAETSSKTKRAVNWSKEAFSRLKWPFAKLLVEYRRFRINSEQLWKEIMASPSLPASTYSLNSPKI